MKGPDLSERLWILGGYYSGLLWTVIAVLWWSWRATPPDQGKHDDACPQD
jgi:hypothetical protein